MKTLLWPLLLVSTEVLAADPSSALSRVNEGSWIAYRVALENPSRAPCCFGSGSVGCRLSGGQRSFGHSDRDPPPRPDETLSVYLRRGRSGAFDRVLAVRSSCPVDTRGERVTELDDVSASDSIALLERGDLEHGVLYAIANHRGGSKTLARMSSEHPDGEVRGEALFWLAQTHRSGAEETIRAAIDRDASPEVQKKAIFALSQLPTERAIASLRPLIESKRPRAIRREALFWLAQINDDAVLPIFDELLR